MTYIGMDVHKGSSTLECLVPATGERISLKIYTKREDLARKLADLPQPWVVALEATYHSPAVCNWLTELGAKIHLTDPQKLSKLAKLRPAKTDRTDAELLLHALVHEYLPEAYLAPPHVVELRALSRGRQKLVERCTALRNQLRAAFAHAGLQVTVTDLRGKQAQEMIPTWLAQLPELARRMATMAWKQLCYLDHDLKQVECTVRKEVRRDPVMLRLTALPGIGPVTALALVAEIGEIERFKQHEQLHCYAGVVPRVSASGERQATGKLVSRCSKPMRYWAVLGANNAARSRSPSLTKSTYRRVKARHGSNTAKIAASRTLLTEVFFIWRKMLPESQAAAA